MCPQPSTTKRALLTHCVETNFLPLSFLAALAALPYMHWRQIGGQISPHSPMQGWLPFSIFGQDSSHSRTRLHGTVSRHGREDALARLAAPIVLAAQVLTLRHTSLVHGSHSAPQVRVHFLWPQKSVHGFSHGGQTVPQLCGVEQAWLHGSTLVQRCLHIWCLASSGDVLPTGRHCPHFAWQACPQPSGSVHLSGQGREAGVVPHLHFTLCGTAFWHVGCAYVH